MLCSMITLPNFHDHWIFSQTAHQKFWTCVEFQIQELNRDPGVITQSGERGISSCHTQGSTYTLFSPSSRLSAREGIYWLVPLFHVSNTNNHKHDPIVSQQTATRFHCSMKLMKFWKILHENILIFFGVFERRNGEIGKKCQIEEMS